MARTRNNFRGGQCPGLRMAGSDLCKSCISIQSLRYGRVDGPLPEAVMPEWVRKADRLDLHMVADTGEHAAEQGVAKRRRSWYSAHYMWVAAQSRVAHVQRHEVHSVAELSNQELKFCLDYVNEYFVKHSVPREFLQRPMAHSRRPMALSVLLCLLLSIASCTPPCTEQSDVVIWGATVCGATAAVGAYRTRLALNARLDPADLYIR